MSNIQQQPATNVAVAPRLVYYQPTPAPSSPPPLPQSSELLPWEKKAQQEARREESRKRILENKKKKNGLLNSLNTAVSLVATASKDAFGVIKDDFMDTQSPQSKIRFNKYFPGFEQENLYGEYVTKMICGTDLVLKGQFYITQNYFAFHAQQYQRYILFMLPLNLITSIQKAVVMKPRAIPQGTPKYSVVPHLNIIPGGIVQVPSSPPVQHHNNNDDEQPSKPKPPKINGLVIFTNDGYQHFFYSIKYFNELYTVLDYAWRNVANINNNNNGNQFVANNNQPIILDQNQILMNPPQQQPQLNIRDSIVLTDPNTNQTYVINEDSQYDNNQFILPNDFESENKRESFIDLSQVNACEIDEDQDNEDQVNENQVNYDQPLSVPIFNQQQIPHHVNEQEDTDNDPNSIVVSNEELENEFKNLST